MALYIAGILLGGILCILSIIMGILALVGGKGRNAIIWGIALVAGLLILVFSVMNVAVNVGEKVVDSVKVIKEMEEKRKSQGSESAVDDKLAERRAFIDTLKGYVGDQFVGKYPTSFYKDGPADSTDDGAIIVPFIYPYSIKYRSGEFLGDIITREDNKTYASNINQLAFDKNFVIAKVDNTNDDKALKDGHSEIEYILFDLRTGEYTPFPNQKKLLEMAGKIGYEGSELMNYLSDDYDGWVAEPDYD